MNNRSESRPELSEELMLTRIEDWWLSKRQERAPQAANYMSSIGYPCLRHLYYLRTIKRPPMDLAGVKAVEAGRIHERLVKMKLMEQGFEVKQDPRSLTFEELDLYGRHDGWIGLDGYEMRPMEVKSVPARIFAGIRGIDDFCSGYWGSLYAHQFNCYLSALAQPFGFIIPTNRENDDAKPLRMDFSPSRWSTTEWTCREVNRHLKDRELPKRISEIGDPEICPKCPFRMQCLPDIAAGGEGVSFIDPAEAEEAAARLQAIEDLKPAADEYERLNRWKRDRFRGVEAMVVGDFLVTGKEIHRKESVVKASDYWKVEILKLGKPRGD